jgi:hypothetical protein
MDEFDPLGKSVSFVNGEELCILVIQLALVEQWNRDV